MSSSSLANLRQLFNQERILLCFNGPISKSLIEEIGKALKNYLDAEQAQQAAAMDVFAAYIEMTQNIRHYALRMGYDELNASATVIISRDQAGRYRVSAGNLVEIEDGERLVQRIQQLAALDKAALKASYKEQLRKPREDGAISGAGLGLIDIARKSNEPLAASLEAQDNGRAFFSLHVVI